MKNFLFILMAMLTTASVNAQVGPIVAQYPDPDDPVITTPVPGDWAYGFYAGIGYKVPMTTLNDNFGSSVMFQVGLTGGFKRFRLKADVAYGQPSIKNKNIFNVPDSAGYQMQGNGNAGTTHLMASVQLGYTVWQNEKLAITPNAGIHYSGYTWDIENYSWTKDDKDIHTRHIVNVKRTSLHNWNWIASVDIDFKLHSHLTSQPLLGGSNYEKFTSWIRISPWMSRAAFSKCDPAVSGCNVGLTVSYFGLGRVVK